MPINTTGFLKHWMEHKEENCYNACIIFCLFCKNFLIHKGALLLRFHYICNFLEPIDIFKHLKTLPFFIEDDKTN